VPANPSPIKFLLSIITYKDSLLLDLFISFEFVVDISMYEGPMLNSIAKESMLDCAVYQYVKLDTYWSLL
jgi:hypothetical protein